MICQMISAPATSTAPSRNHGTTFVRRWRRRRAATCAVAGAGAAAVAGPGARWRRRRTRRRGRGTGAGAAATDDGSAQRGGEGRPVGVPRGRILGERPGDDRGQVGRHRGGQRRAPAGAGGRPRSRRRLGDEGATAGQALEGDAGRGCRRRRRRWPCRPRPARARGRRACPSPARSRSCASPSAARAMPKSVTLITPVGRDDQVAGLDVAVHDPGAVGGAERVGGLGHQVARDLGDRAERSGAAARRAAGPRRAPSRGRGAACPTPSSAWPRRSRRRSAMPGWCSEAACWASLSNRRRKVGSSAYSAFSSLTATGAAQGGVATAPDLAHAAGRDPRGEGVAVRVVGEPVVLGHVTSPSPPP